MDSLLLEIGTEEIPAGYISPALEALSSTLLQNLTDARIEHGAAKVFGTPRKLTVKVENVAAKQKSIKTEVIGPPTKIGLDEKGNPTVAARKFAQKLNLAVNKLSIKETDKGFYLCVEKTEKGQPTRNILINILPEIILSTPFPKKMRWADLDIEFARPIYSILALLGKSVIPFQLGNLKSSRYTHGHYFMSPAKIKITDADDYVDALRSAHVLVDIDERREKLKQDVIKVARNLGGRVLPDEELVDINTNLVEYPIAVAGNFDKEFLEVPDEVLINAMREHQKYFSVIGQDGRLMPCLIAVNNTAAKDMALVATGHERVIRARLADAQFFYRGDLNISDDQRVDKLKKVLFQAQLGTMYEKTERIAKIAEYLASAAIDGSGLENTGNDLKKQVSRAARLCKADLVSQVVGEFPKLQGVIGKIYATLSGELPSVAAAIEEHYRPVYSGAPLPETLVGAILGIADKIDSICGCFSVGLIPTGASDPYALRRQGIGIVQIMNDKGFSFSLKELILQSLTLFGQKSAEEINDLTEKVYTFIKNRIARLLAEEDYSKDIITATVDVSIDHVPNVWNRVRALEALKARPDFEALVAGFKRVGNILKKSDEYGLDSEHKEVNQDLFEHQSELALFSAFREVEKKVVDAMEQGFFDQALVDIASLRVVVDAFFDEVMVLAEDKHVRRNRLALLGCITALFG
ncbi:MAG: glycine--tRNA ligase subunit beta, partial [Planctomycetota bacterium]